MITTDLLIIGGGINGVGVARDAAGQGIKVFLCEQDDLAQHTSSASTKLIHGGLRYLENYDLMLVRHALQERERLLRITPHIIWPVWFVLPHHRQLRSKWLIRLGLFLYDHIGGRQRLPASRRLDLGKHPAGKVLQSGYSTGFEYSDCRVKDSRLVVLSAMDAAAQGAIVKTHTRCIGLQRHPEHWVATLRDQADGRRYPVRARALVNAAGPWVEPVLALDRSSAASHQIRLVKGSHIVVPKLFDHDYAYLFQNADGRVLFAIPYERDFTLLGTTDVELKEMTGRVQVSAEETAYICQAVSQYFRRPVTPDQVVWSFSGVRPLYDNAASNASKVTRDYHLHLDTEAAPIVSVFGGKITTYRKLAEQVMGLLAGPLQVTVTSWTADRSLPGGDIANADFEGFLEECRRRYPWLPAELLQDYASTYGTRISVLLEGCGGMGDLGQHFEGQLYERELDYLMAHEYARTVEDVLWRRTKRGLRVSREAGVRIDQWMSRHQTNDVSLMDPVTAEPKR